MTRSLRAILLPATFLVLASCGGLTAGTEEPPDVWCWGDPVLIVRNLSSTEMEVVEYGSRGQQTVIAHVGNGRREIPIRRQSSFGYLARLVGGRRIVATLRGRSSGIRDYGVTLERVCREQ